MTSPSGPSASPWVSVISVPAGPRSVSRTRPLMFWPRSTTWTPGRSSTTDTGRSSSTARTGGAGEVDQGVVAAVADLDRLPVVDADEPPVLALALDQVGGLDVRRRPAPGLVGADDSRGPVLVLELELDEERGPRAPLVGGAGDADLAAVPAVGQQRADLVGARGQQRGDVVRLHLEAERVLGEARRELVGRDPGAVDLELVDPVRGRVQGGAADRALDDDLGAEQVRRAEARGLSPVAVGEIQLAVQSMVTKPFSRRPGSARGRRGRARRAPRSPEAAGPR